MRKFCLISLILLVSLCLASTGYCAANNWGNTDTMRLLKLTVPTYIASIGTGLTGAATTMVTTDTVIPVTYATVRITISSRTCTLANGVKGQVLTLVGIDAISGTVTISPATSTGWASVAMATNGHSLTLLYVDDTTGWIIIGYSGVTITYKNSSSI